MRDLEARLDPRRFVRIHRSTIVALDRVAELRASTHGDHCVRLRQVRDPLRISLLPPTAVSVAILTIYRAT